MKRVTTKVVGRARSPDAPKTLNGRKRCSAHGGRVLPVRRRKPAWWKGCLATLQPGMERETMLNPLWVAESVVQEAVVYVDEPFPEIYATWLAEKAEHCYIYNKWFRRQIRGSGNSGRSWLFAFMRHWLAGILFWERPDLFSRFPYSWVNGEKLTGRADGTCRNYIEGCHGRSDWPTGSRSNPLLRHPRHVSGEN